jgi:phage/plasmid-like protein (TIGR03299 family)
MAHEVETAVYFREKAWHGLGTVVEEAPDSKKALELAGLDWVVEPQPMYLQNNHQVPGYQANVRSSDGKVLGVVSNRYQIVQNKEAFDFTDSLIGNGLKYESAGSLRGGKRIWLLGQTHSVKILGDDVENYICFTNSHDGSGAVQVCMTPVRVVCNNTLNLALNSAERKWSTRHIGNLQMKLDEAKYTLELADKYVTELAKEAEKYANITVNTEKLEKILTNIFPADSEDTDRKKKNIQEKKDNFYMCYMAHDIQKFMGTAWGVINAASDYVGHIAPARRTESYNENNWGKIMTGHPILDKVTSLVSA